MNRNQRYDDYVAKRIAKTEKLMQVQMRQNTFDPANPISILSFLLTFKTTGKSNGVSEGATMWHFHSFIRNSAASITKARARLRQSSKK